MALPWLRLLDGVLGARDIIGVVRQRGAVEGPERGSLEAPLAGVVVGALREAFHRDSERLELERQRLDEERTRAERALQFELLRQAGGREVARLTLLTLVALVSLLGTLFLVTRVSDQATSARVALGIGGLLTLAALAAALSAHARVSRVLGTANASTRADDLLAAPDGRMAPWLLVSGLAASALGILAS